MRLEAYDKAVISGLRLVLLVVDEPLGLALATVEPAVRIGHAPDHEFTHVRFFEEYVHELAVEMALFLVVLCAQAVCGTLRESDVELGDVQRDSQFGECLGEVADVFRCGFVRDFDMGLRAYSGDGNPVLFPTLHLFQNESCLATGT